MRTSSLALLSLLFLACDAPGQPDTVPGSSSVSAPNAAAATKKAAPTAKAALRIGSACSQPGFVCTSYNIVSVDASTIPGATIVTVDPTIDLTTSVVLVSGDTSGVATSHVWGFPTPNVLTVSVSTLSGAVAQYQWFSLLVF